MTMAMAAPWMRSSGAPKWPKISTQLRKALRQTDAMAARSGTFTCRTVRSTMVTVRVMPIMG